MIIKQWLTVMTIGGLVLSCSSPQLRVQSDPPNAEVLVAQQGAKLKKLIGVTPLDISYKDLMEKVGSPGPGEYLVMSVESKDLEADKILIPTTTFGTKTVSIKVQMTPKADTKTANSILQRLHNAQKFAQGGEYERAQIEVDKALEIDPLFVRSISMKGSIYYLQKNYDEANQWFERALKVDSGFDEAIKMIAKIKQERK